MPLILVLSVSGSIYLFKPQIESFRERPYTNLACDVEKTSPNQQIDAAMAAMPGAKFEAYRLALNSNDAKRISIIRSGQRYFVYVNPCSLEVLGTEAVNGIFITWVKDLHGELLSGKVGTLIVELAASWTIILVLTGLYLWWPRNRNMLAGVLFPRWRHGRRVLLRDLHAVTGFWIAFLVLFLLISGLPWTSVWGEAFKEVRKLSQPNSSAQWQNSSQGVQQAWQKKAVDNYDLPIRVLQTADVLDFYWPVELSVSDVSKNEWKLASLHQNRPLRKTAWIDGGSGEVLAMSSFEDKALIDRAVGFGIAAHEGQLFGWFNQALGLLATSGLIVMTVSGFMMWRSRKPSYSLGALPSHKTHFSPMLFLPLILLPTVLLSFIVILIFEKLLVPRVPALAQWLGITLANKQAK